MLSQLLRSQLPLCISASSVVTDGDFYILLRSKQNIFFGHEWCITFNIQKGSSRSTSWTNKLFEFVHIPLPQVYGILHTKEKNARTNRSKDHHTKKKDCLFFNDEIEPKPWNADVCKNWTTFYPFIRWRDTYRHINLISNSLLVFFSSNFLFKSDLNAISTHQRINFIQLNWQFNRNENDKCQFWKNDSEIIKSLRTTTVQLSCIYSSIKHQINQRFSFAFGWNVFYSFIIDKESTWNV